MCLAFAGLLLPQGRSAGIIRWGPGGRPISTIVFEYWREGLEDCDYLALLKEARNRLAALPAEVRSEHRALLRRADFFTRVPDYVTTGVMGGRTRIASETADPSISVGFAGNTDDMDVILATRRTVAELIATIEDVVRQHGPIRAGDRR